MALTDTAIRSAKPTAKPYKLGDSGGLFLLVTPQGAKLWRMKFRHAGKEGKLSFGSYPEISLRTARERRDAARAQVAQGKNPAQEKRRDDARARLSVSNTFAAVAKDFIAKREREGLAPITIKTHHRYLSLLADIAERPIAEIEAFELLDALRKIERRGRYETAINTREFAGRVFRYAVASTLAPRDIAADLRGALQTPPDTGFPAIVEPKRVGELLRAIDGFEGQPATMLALKLAPLVFQRPGEVVRMEWSELDLDAAVWRLPEGRKKERRAHAVPLPTQAVAILRQALELAMGGPYVFPNARTIQRPMTTEALNAALRRMGFDKSEHVTHGWRKTASTLLNESNKWNPDAIERALAHKDVTTRGVYNIGAYWDERVRMAQWWADYLDTLRTGADIVPFKKEA
jgi:integrase